MSASGRYLALTTGRTKFSLPALQLLGPPRAVPGPQEMYVVDLHGRTLERATRSVLGGDVDGGAQDGVTISADGSQVAFSSFAGNLFFGDANQRPDAFVATRLPEPPADGATAGGAQDGVSSLTVSRSGPRVIVRAKTKAGGVAILTITVPAAGRVEAVAVARTGKPAKPRAIARRRTHARGKGTFNVVMRVRGRFRAALRDGHELHARVKVAFSPAAGGRRLHGSTAVTFAD